MFFVITRSNPRLDAHCRHRSRVSFRVLVTSRYVSSQSPRQFQFSRAYSSASHSSTACVLAGRGLECPVSVCVLFHERRECDDFEQALCTRDTFRVSCDTLHVHLVALSGTKNHSCCFPHTLRDVCALLSHAQQLSHKSLVHSSLVVLRLDQRLGRWCSLKTWTRRSRVLRSKHGRHASDVLHIRFNQESTSCSHDHSAKKEYLVVQLCQSSHNAHHDLSRPMLN